MKIFITFLVTFLLSISIYSQVTNLKDTSISLSSEQLEILYSPTGLVKTVLVSTTMFKSGRLGMEFLIILMNKEKIPELASDNIAFIYSKEKILTLNNPYRDTIYYRNDGALCLNVIHWLDKSQVSTLKQNAIKAIILKVDGKLKGFTISTKSQQKLIALINKNL